MIKTFRSRGPELLSARKSVALFHPIELAQGVEQIVRRKLAQLNAAEELSDLAIPPENCLGPVSRERRGEYSIRITHCWELCFVWRDHDAYDVDLVRSYAPGNLTVARTESGLLPPIHPGEILRQDFTRPHLIGVKELALALEVPPAQIYGIVHEQLSITDDVALGLGLFFGSTAKLWLNLQRDYDLQVAESAKLAAIERAVQ
jgi:addiction module HigA family antidote